LQLQLPSLLPSPRPLSVIPEGNPLLAFFPTKPKDFPSPNPQNLQQLNPEKESGTVLKHGAFHSVTPLDKIFYKQTLDFHYRRYT
jgi:hypothetical protein